MSDLSEGFVKGEIVYAKYGVAYYKASIIDIEPPDSAMRYKVHYTKYSPKYDEWKSARDLLKDTKENRVLVKQIYFNARRKEKSSQPGKVAHLSEEESPAIEIVTPERKLLNSKKSHASCLLQYLCF
jgi:hypothetical protein